jgi:hypothetical protein
MTTIKRARPLPVRLLNRIGKLSPATPSLALDRMLDAAKSETGLSDFGDNQFMTPLKRLIEAFESEADLSTLGRISAKNSMVRLLANRLLIQDYCKKHPEILKQEISRPLIILGLPRTGTTILFNTLSMDPNSRSPLTWEASEPCPPPTVEGYHSDPRIKATQNRYSLANWVAPELRSMHEMNALLPQECGAILSHEFLGEEFPFRFKMPEFGRWMHTQSWMPAYRYHKVVLQMLQANVKSERWLLKNPSHLPVIDDLLEVYPDACIVHTHRDPMRVMASFASLAYTVKSATSDKIDPVEVGRDQLEVWGEYLNKALAVRMRRGKDDKQFFDVQFEDVVSQPMQLIERIYAHFDLPLSAETKQKMQKYLQDNPQGKHGGHRYELEDYGLSAERDSIHFQRYCEYFGVKTQR